MAPTSGQPESTIDTIVTRVLERHGEALRPPCADPAFLRRVRLDITGVLSLSNLEILHRLK